MGQIYVYSLKKELAGSGPFCSLCVCNLQSKVSLNITPGICKTVKMSQSIRMKLINQISSSGFLKIIVTRTNQENPNNETKDSVGTFDLGQSFPWFEVYLKHRAGLKHQLQWYPLKCLFIPALTIHKKSKSINKLQVKCMWSKQDHTKVTYIACITTGSR